MVAEGSLLGRPLESAAGVLTSQILGELLMTLQIIGLVNTNEHHPFFILRMTLIWTVHLVFLINLILALFYGILYSMLKIANLNEFYAPYAKPGGWNG